MSFPCASARAWQLSANPLAALPGFGICAALDVHPVGGGRDFCCIVFLADVAVPCPVVPPAGGIDVFVVTVGR